MTIILSNVTDFQKSFTEKFFSKFFSKVIIKDHITPHRPTHRYTTLWNINVRKQAINDKWQGSDRSVATYLRCGEIVNNHFNKGLLLSLSVIFLIGEYLTKSSKNVVVWCTSCAAGHHTARRRIIHYTSWVWRETAVVNTVVTPIFTLPG